jgi:hypothetical protein
MSPATKTPPAVVCQPARRLRLVGPAVALHVGETLHAAFPDRFGDSPHLRKIVDAGLR